MSLVNKISTWNYVRGNTIFDDKLAYEMLLEELTEFYQAKTAVDRADALGDLAFVALGELYKLSGSDLKAEAIMFAITNANFKKGADKDENGKVIKPSDFVGPEEEIATILEAKWDSYLNKNEHLYQRGLFDED